MVSHDLIPIAAAAECGKIGDKFSLYLTLNLCSKLEENKQRFVKHWNKERCSSLRTQD